MSDATFFGYGSLVNLATHAYQNPRPAQIDGWRRVWHSLDGNAYATLSVTRAVDSTLHGIEAAVPGGDWAALDAREAGYDRQTLPHGTAIYEVTQNIVKPTPPQPILRSYLDVVVQGYLNIYGPEGVAGFFATTDGWRAILDDRSSPIYPRHQILNPDETALVDHHLAAVVQ